MAIIRQQEFLHSDLAANTRHLEDMPMYIHTSVS